MTNKKIYNKQTPKSKASVRHRIMAALCVSTLSTAPAFAADLFVATNGIDNTSTNNGSISQPWASLDFALNRVAAGDTINIRAGNYHEKITKGSVSGTSAQPITIQSYNGELVTFDGTIGVTGSWTQHSGNIYKLQLTEPVWQLFVDDEMMMNARWPNARFDDGSVYTRESWAKGLDATTTNGHFDTDPAIYDLAAENINVTGAVVIANVRNFDTYTRTVTAHSAGSNVFDHGVTPFFGSSKNYYYLQGALSLLDQDKEWHIDAATNMAYFWAPGGGAPTGNIRGRNQQFVIDANNWNYVNFKGLNFFATTIELSASESITIEDCNFNYGGASKRALGATTSKASVLRLTNTVGAGNFVLRNISIRNSDSQAFVIKGENTLVENSLFENIDWAASESYAPSASLVFQGNNTLFSRNTIRNAGTSETIATATSVAGGASSITAEYNDIYNTGYAQSDGAQIQIRIEAQDGTVLHHNWLHDTPKYGFRFDAPVAAQEWGDNGFSHHNVVWNSSGANPKGDNDRHYHDLLFDNTNVDLIILNEQAANGDWSNEFTKTVNNAADSISGNRTTQAPVPGIVGSNFNGYNETVVLKTLLRDPANHDFRPVPGSSLVDAGEVISDADFSHPTQGAAPDIGSYEEGNNNYWIPGRQLPAASYPIPFHAGSTTKTDADLMWRQAYTATSYNVYLGTTSGSLVYQGNQTNNIFDPGTLTVGQTYYWRIDAVTPTGTIMGTQWSFSIDATPVSTRLTPIADAYVDDKLPDTNKGNDSLIRLVTPVTPGGSFQQRFGYLKFDVDVPGTITSAKLKLYNPSGSTNKEVNVHTVTDTSWGETLITWNNQPTMGASLQEFDIAGTSWQEFDVLSAISGNGLLSLGLKRAPLDSRREVASKEGTFIPELIIEYTPAKTEVIASTNSIVFSANSTTSQQVTIKNKHAVAINIAAADFTITNQMGSAAASYTLDTSDCEGSLAVNSSCSVVVHYLPSAGFGSQLIQFTDPKSGDVLPIFLSNYYQESAATQAFRRLTPVIENVQLFDQSNTELTSNQLTAVASDKQYTVRWTVLTYEPLVAQAYLYDCDHPSTTACARKFDADSGKLANTATITGVTLTPTEVTDGGYDDYSFNGQSAIHQQFEGTITIEPGDFSAAVASPHNLALRFVHSSVTDSQRGFSNVVSTSLSGNLDFVGQGDSGYFDTTGRALVLTGHDGP